MNKPSITSPLPMAIILETKRLILRYQVIKDLDDLWALYCNPNITKYIPDRRAPAQKRKRNWNGTFTDIPGIPKLDCGHTLK